MSESVHTGTDAMAAIASALETAAQGRPLKVELHEDLRGAALVGDRVEAYMYPAAIGFVVDLFAPLASGPYEVVPTPDLVNGCSGRAPARPRHYEEGRFMTSPAQEVDDADPFQPSARRSR